MIRCTLLKAVDESYAGLSFVSMNCCGSNLLVGSEQNIMWQALASSVTLHILKGRRMSPLRYDRADGN